MNINALLYIDDGLTDDDLDFMGSYLPDVLKQALQDSGIFSSVSCCISSGYSGNLKNSDAVIRENKDDVAFWKKAFSEIKTGHIAKIYCDSPFLDIEILKDMIAAHSENLAEFTYSENLPSGFSCEIISKDLVEAIPVQDEKTLPLGQVIRSNINRFDVELYYKEPEMRDKRLSFRSGTPRERLIMENIVRTAGRKPSYTDIKQIIDDNPAILYLSPSYVEIELTGRCDLDCIFCFRKTLKKPHNDMETGLFKKILADMSVFSLPYSICLGGSGEPLMHNNFYEVLDLAKNENLIQNIVIETNGLLAEDNFMNYLKTIKDNRIKIIFNINGMNDETYKAIHGGDYFNRVYRNITAVKDICPSGNVYIQIMKINETESYLDKYYDFWEKQGIPIILQKQNTFTGRITDRTYSDLSPMERTPCWHLQRDINILSDGTVTFCKQDVDGDTGRGNLNNESIQQIFKNSGNSFLNNYKNDYPARPDCSSCDEWYTFNL